MDTKYFKFVQNYNDLKKGVIYFGGDKFSGFYKGSKLIGYCTQNNKFNEYYEIVTKEEYDKQEGINSQPKLIYNYGIL